MERITKQRSAIFKVLQQTDRPLSIDEILAAARAEYPKLAERTVFRHLKELTRESKLVRLNFPGQPNRFEIPSGLHHPHVICRDCQKVFNLEHETPNLSASYPAPAGFELDGEEVVFFGRCKVRDCKHKRCTDLDLNPLDNPIFALNSYIQSGISK